MPDSGSTARRSSAFSPRPAGKLDRLLIAKVEVAARADLSKAVDTFRAALVEYRKEVDELGDYELLGESSVWEWRCEQMLRGIEE